MPSKGITQCKYSGSQKTFCMTGTNTLYVLFGHITRR